MRLAAFGDEIAADLSAQLAVLQECDIYWLDLRSAWDTNVLDLNDGQISEIESLLSSYGIRVATIASPLGKAPVDVPWEAYLRRFDRALDLAEIFKTPQIRIFSFYPPQQTMAPERYFGEAVLRLREMAGIAASGNVELLLENERGVWGDTAARCRQLLEAVAEPNLQAVFDPANFIQVGQDVQAAFDMLRPWIRLVHVKDALPDGVVVPAGAGVADWPRLLRRLQQEEFSGFLSLEPHLAAAGAFGGFTGAERFREAAAALRTVLRAAGVTEEGPDRTPSPWN